METILPSACEASESLRRVELRCDAPDGDDYLYIPDEELARRPSETYERFHKTVQHFDFRKTKVSLIVVSTGLLMPWQLEETRGELLAKRITDMMDFCFGMSDDIERRVEDFVREGNTVWKLVGGNNVEDDESHRRFLESWHPTHNDGIEWKLLWEFLEGISRAMREYELLRSR